VVPTVPRRDSASNPGHALRSVALPRHHRDDDDDDDDDDPAIPIPGPPIKTSSSGRSTPNDTSASPPPSA